jgi:predicted HTH domain antitoxin
MPFGLTEDEAKILLAIKLYEVGNASLGQAAKMVGYSKGAFVDILGRSHIPVPDEPAKKLREEIGL